MAERMQGGLVRRGIWEGKIDEINKNIKKEMKPVRACARACVCNVTIVYNVVDLMTFLYTAWGRGGRSPGYQAIMRPQ